jgi:hypothetical protein
MFRLILMDWLSVDHKKWNVIELEEILLDGDGNS